MVAETALIIVDDHAIFRLGVRSVIQEQLPSISILGECSSGQELLDYLKGDNQIPDIILLDIIMPDINGIEVTKIVRQKYPDIKIIILSTEVKSDTIAKLLDFGIQGFLSKLTIEKDLANAISIVINNGIFYTQDVSKIIYNVYVAKAITNSKFNNCIDNTEYKHITPKEKDIIELLCNGHSAKNIAEQLCMSRRTVESHKSNIMQKLGFNNIVELIRFAIKEKIITI